MNKNVRKTSSTHSLVTAASLGAALLASPQAIAQEVTLKSINDDSINLIGDFVSFQNDVYTIDTDIGRLNIRASNIECIGEACPNNEVAIQTGPVVWDVSLWGGRRAFTEHVEKLAELVAQNTDGQLTLNISYGGLSPSRENLDGISNGDFEMAQFCSGYHPEKNPSLTVLELPFLGVSSMEEERAVSEAVYNHPAVIADLARWNATILMPTPQPQYNIIGVGSPPTSLASFETMIVRATGGAGDAIQALGAETVNLPADEVNGALTRGEINAVAFAPHAHMSFNTVDSAIWWTSNLNPGTANCPVVVNSQALEQLPASSRIALLSSVDQAVDFFIENYTVSTMSAWEQTLTEREIIQLTLSDEILGAINSEVAGPTVDTWITEKAALGLPAQDLYDLVNSTLQSIR
ncbi:MAG: C4-dicarboxylate ABC transporter substrate-binding protein [Pseudomonadota bacterium]